MCKFDVQIHCEEAFEAEAAMRPCSRCGGKGFVAVSCGRHDGDIDFEDCRDCAGEGWEA